MNKKDIYILSPIYLTCTVVIIDTHKLDDEDSIESLVTFEQDARALPADVTMLRLLMDQHGLAGAGFPEIGDKILISRILAGQSRNHGHP